MSRPLPLAIAQFRPNKGDYAGNLKSLGDWFAHADSLVPRPRILHLPETALTGYFVEGAVRDLAMTAGSLARDLDATYREAVTGPRTLDVVIGFYETWRSTLYNSAMCVGVGGNGPTIRHVHRKVFLPTYGMFDEERFVERGHDVRAFDAPWGRSAMLVCEDAWHSITGTIAALDDAQVIFVSAAAPARGIHPRDNDAPGPASVQRWERLIRDIAEEHGVFVSLSNLAGSEGGKVFQGAGLVAGPRGDVRIRGPLFDEALVACALDLDDLTRVRADMPLLSDLRTALPHLREMLATVAEKEQRRSAVVAFDAARDAAAGSGDVERVARDARGAPPEQQDTISPPSLRNRPDASAITVVRGGATQHDTPPPLDIDGPLVERWLVSFLRDELRRRGFRRAIVGLSGGVDSAVTATLAARALGAANVTAVRMPYRTSSPDSLNHAQLVIDQLCVEARTIDISAAVDGYLALEPDADASRRGNVMARVRMAALFDLSARYSAIPLGTGNKSERLFGYFTWHADDAPPINPIGDLYKTQVWALARHLGVPDAIIEKPASADLIAGQTDESDFGISYERADRILDWLLHGFTPEALVARGFALDDVALVRRRLDATHWKRRLPTVAMLGSTAIGESYLRPVDF